jgi:hypothetical protein
MESELEHYEGCAPGEDWYSFYFFLDAVVTGGYEKYKPDWHSRALRLAEKYLGTETIDRWGRRTVEVKG